MNTKQIIGIIAAILALLALLTLIPFNPAIAVAVLLLAVALFF